MLIISSDKEKKYIYCAIAYRHIEYMKLRRSHDVSELEIEDRDCEY